MQLLHPSKQEWTEIIKESLLADRLDQVCCSAAAHCYNYDPSAFVHPCTLLSVLVFMTSIPHANLSIAAPPLPKKTFQHVPTSYRITTCPLRRQASPLVPNHHQEHICMSDTLAVTAHFAHTLMCSLCRWKASFGSLWCSTAASTRPTDRRRRSFPTTPALQRKKS